jgi:hypothetical protein
MGNPDWYSDDELREIEDDYSGDPDPEEFDMSDPYDIETDVPWGGMMNESQIVSLVALCTRYKVEFNPEGYKPAFDLPDGYVAGWVGPIYVRCSPEGAISS